jgi:glucosamine-6-phosphate deaminase
MKVLILQDPARAVARTAEMILDQIRRKPDTVLGLATGGTMEPVYARLRAAAGAVSFSEIRSFNLDEYVGLAADHPQSYHHYMRRQLFDHVDADPANLRLPAGDAGSASAEAARYDAAIRAAGGIDLQLLGLGANGHIGFNEPGSSLGSRTRVKTLTQKTRDDNRRFFGPEEAVPRWAITMGIGTIMEAREIVLLATGAAKAAAVKAMIEGPVSAFCPASVLQFHPRATMVLDAASAARLELREYYETVHPQGEEVYLD